MSNLDDVFSIAKQLSCHDRWLLAHMLWDSLPPSEAWEGGKLGDEDIAELDRRVANLDAGRVEAIPGDVVRKRLREWIDGSR